MIATGDPRRFGILINCIWACYNIILLSAAPYATLWQLPRKEGTTPDPQNVETVRALEEPGFFLRPHALLREGIHPRAVTLPALFPGSLGMIVLGLRCGCSRPNDEDRAR